MDSTELILKLIREKYESIRQFAIMADIPYSTVKSGLRAGIQGITVETVFKMCYVLQIRVDSLFPRNAGPEETASFPLRNVTCWENTALCQLNPNRRSCTMWNTDMILTAEKNGGQTTGFKQWRQLV